MTTNRLFHGFGLLVVLVTAALLAIPVAISTLNVAPTIQGLIAPSSSRPDPVAAEQARLAFRRGEWNAGGEDIYTPLDLHDRQTSAAAAELRDPEVQRFIRYADQISTDLASQAWLNQRRGEWNEGTTELDVEQSRIAWRLAK